MIREDSWETIFHLGPKGREKGSVTTSVLRGVQIKLPGFFSKKVCHGAPRYWQLLRYFHILYLGSLFFITILWSLDEESEAQSSLFCSCVVSTTPHDPSWSAPPSLSSLSLTLEILGSCSFFPVFWKQCSEGSYGLFLSKDLIAPHLLTAYHSISLRRYVNSVGMTGDV